jgi:ribonuclease VapC
MTTFVLDTFAVVAYMNLEQGHETVIDLLTAADAGECQLLMSAVNACEVLYVALREEGPEAMDRADAQLRSFPVQLISADMDLASKAARFKATRKMSLADCFAAALARQHEAEVVTGDPGFAAVEDDIAVRWLRAAD